MTDNLNWYCNEMLFHDFYMYLDPNGRRSISEVRYHALEQSLQCIHVTLIVADHYFVAMQLLLWAFVLGGNFANT